MIKSQFESCVTVKQSQALQAERRKTAFDKMDVQIVTADRNLVYKAEPKDSPVVIPSKNYRVPSIERFGGMKPFQHHAEQDDSFEEDKRR